MEERAFDLIEWEPPPERLRYCDFNNTKSEDSVKGRDICMVMTEVMSMCDFEADENDKILYPVTTGSKDAAEAKFPLSLKRIYDEHFNNVRLMEMIKRAQRNVSK